mgnify:CR=1 FL=1
MAFGTGNNGLSVTFMTLKAFKRIEMRFMNVGYFFAFDF